MNVKFGLSNAFFELPYHDFTLVKLHYYSLGVVRFIITPCTCNCYLSHYHFHAIIFNIPHAYHLLITINGTNPESPKPPKNKFNLLIIPLQFVM